MIMDDRESSASGSEPSRGSETPGGTESQPSEGLEDAFVKFYRASVPRLVVFVRMLGASCEDAADIVQDTMILTYRRWGTINHPDAYARRVASRALIRRVTNAREIPSDRLDGRPLLRPSAPIAEWEDRHEILRVMDLLPPRQRQVMAWSLDGYTPAQIADELKVTPEAVRASLRKARVAVRGYLDGRGCE
jgi:RNA polymerase sigma factor (sigma-70 family)